MSVLAVLGLGLLGLATASTQAEDAGPPAHTDWATELTGSFFDAGTSGEIFISGLQGLDGWGIWIHSEGEERPVEAEVYGPMQVLPEICTSVETGPFMSPKRRITNPRRVGLASGMGEERRWHAGVPPGVIKFGSIPMTTFIW